MSTESLERVLGISFRTPNLLRESLTHRSYLNEHPDWDVPHNERLEFLGDAVLELAVTEALFAKFPSYPEGQLTVFRAALVNYQQLSRIAAEELHLEDFIYMSKGERGDTSRAREVILANAIEAVIGAIYADSGFEAARAFVKRFILVRLDDIISNRSYKDAKSELQEIVQERLRVTPSYRVLEETGPAHRRTFKVGVYFGEEFVADGAGPSKQEAELEAAKKAVEKYR